MDSLITPLVTLGLGWIAYFLLHSLLASLASKRWIEHHRAHWLPGYRLLFNAVAILLILPILWFTYSIDAAPLWRWTGPLAWLANGLALLAVIGFLWTSRYYESGEFIGIRQWRDRETRVGDQEHLHVSPAHRWIRHPWYFFGLVLMWTRDMNPPILLTITMATLYFIVGSRLEERKLLTYYGDAYARYRERVPGLFPIPWRHLSSGEADELEQMARVQSASTTPEVKK